MKEYQQEHQLELLSNIGNYASVQACTSCENGIVHVHFLNASIRMCRHQFKTFTLMLNEAMMKLVVDNQNFANMKSIIKMSELFRNPGKFDTNVN
jgi:hypothetical protein